MSNIIDKLALANNKVPNVYDAGKSCKDMTDFRYYCYNNSRLDMLDCINTCSGTVFTSMFEKCTSITTIPQLNTSNGLRFYYMFNGCSSLKTIPQLNTSKAFGFSGMFMNCTSLTTIPKLDTSNADIFHHMFHGCSSLKTIPEIDLSKGREFDNIFYGCTNLYSIKILNGIGLASISFASSPLLDASSAMSIIYGLKVNTSDTKPTLTLHSEAWYRLESYTPPAGYDTWQLYITNYKNWLYA